MLSVRRLGLGDTDGALAVWLAANEARGRASPPARRARVREKITDPAALSMVAANQDAVIGMALGEPGRHANGAGSQDPSLLHLSMVFVDPAHWGNGVGRTVLEALFMQARREGYMRTTLWTGAGNDRACRLYTRLGLRPTGLTKTLTSHGVVVQFGADLAMLG